MKIALACLIATGLVASPALAAKEPTPLVRGFESGVFTDEYFGLRFELDGLAAAERQGDSANWLFRGRTDAGVQVELSVIEHGPGATHVDWLGQAKKTWARTIPKRSDVEEGAEPHAWTIFAAPNGKGGQRQDGYAFYPNGKFLFTVHASVAEKTANSGDAIRNALDALEVSDAPNAFLVVDQMVRGNGEDPRTPQLIAKAASVYLREGPRRNPQLAVLAAESALATGKKKLDGSEQWQVNYLLGHAQLQTGRDEDAADTWKRCVKLSKKTNDPDRSAAVSRYNLAATYARLGNEKKAFRELEKAFELEAEAVRSSLRDGAPADDDFAELRSDARWKELFGR